MAEKRRDHRGRILRDGESVRADGRYSYRFTTPDGRRHEVYSWQLEKTDKVPPGKRCKEPLREMEKRILKDLGDGISPDGGKAILNDCIEKYLDSKQNLRNTTLNQYHYLVSLFVKNSIGQKQISSITYSTVLAFYNDLYKNGVSFGTISLVNNVLHPTFDRCVRDGLIRLNPTTCILREFKDTHTVTREKKFALTRAEQAAFFNYIKNDRRFALIEPLLETLAKTGARIGEISGLTWRDVDLEAGTFNINHSLMYRPNAERKNIFYVNPVKTAAGNRTIPLSPDVRQAFLRAKEAQATMGLTSPTIDGFSDFVFLNSSGLPFSSTTVNKWITNVIEECNARERELAAREQREPCLIRRFSCHSLRHTFATRAVESGMHVKALQQILGHEDITMTLNVYSESQDDFVAAEFEKMQAFN